MSQSTNTRTAEDEATAKYLRSVGVDEVTIAKILMQPAPPPAPSTKRKIVISDDEEEVDDDEKAVSDSEEDEDEEKAKKRTKLLCHCSAGWVCLNTNQAWAKRNDQVKGLDTVCLKECGAGGDCLFYAIARGYYAWKDPHISNRELQEKADEHMMQARAWAASAITAENVKDVLKVYQQEWFADYAWQKYLKRRDPNSGWSSNPQTWKPNRWGGTFTYRFPRDNLLVPEEWRNKEVKEEFPIPEPSAPFLDSRHPQFQTFPQKSTGPVSEEEKQQSVLRFTAETFRRLIKTQGEKFYGDDRSLEWIVDGQDSPFRQEEVGFIVLSNLGRINCGLYPNDRYVKWYMLLYSIHNAHWKLAGVSIPDGETGEYVTRSVFAREHIPQVIQTIWVQDCIHNANDARQVDADHPMIKVVQQTFSRSQQ